MNRISTIHPHHYQPAILLRSQNGMSPSCLKFPRPSSCTEAFRFFPFHISARKQCTPVFTSPGRLSPSPSSLNSILLRWTYQVPLQDHRQNLCKPYIYRFTHLPFSCQSHTSQNGQTNTLKGTVQRHRHLHEEEEDEAIQPTSD
jgi:hypothetical protein